MEKLIFKDELNDEVVTFYSDAEQSFVDGIPEVEWYAVKNVLINFGYKVIETTDN